MIDTSDSRFPKAVAIADQAGQWLKCRTSQGRKAYGVPSQRTAGRYYLVTQTSCTCEDAKRHQGSICKQALAVQIHCARMVGNPIPASDVVDGLAEMVAERHPVLEMVRHPTVNSRGSGPSRPLATTSEFSVRKTPGGTNRVQPDGRFQPVGEPPRRSALSQPR
jgi:hypothetical protein